MKMGNGFLWILFIAQAISSAGGYASSGPKCQCILPNNAPAPTGPTYCTTAKGIGEACVCNQENGACIINSGPQICDCNKPTATNLQGVVSCSPGSGCAAPGVTCAPTLGPVADMACGNKTTAGQLITHDCNDSCTGTCSYEFKTTIPGGGGTNSRFYYGTCVPELAANPTPSELTASLSTLLEEKSDRRSSAKK